VYHRDSENKTHLKLLEEDTPMKLALATSRQYLNMDPDNQLLLPVLKAAGFSVTVALWDEPNINWDAFDVCLIRSTWDYHTRLTEYLTWIDHVATQTRLLNPAPVIRWNANKRYLQELETQGIPVVETLWTTPETKTDIQEVLTEAGWDKAVVKPVVSASGHETHVVSLSTISAEQQAALNTLMTTQDLMIQPYLESIETDGEISLLYFGGRFSHALVKRPAKGEFRTQEHFGGQFTLIPDTPELLTLGERILSLVPGETPLYARVDLMTNPQGQPCLSELELIEPSFFLKLDPQSPARMAQALSERCRSASLV
jgi:glutathione synthase/RimK-type ligase-like ATP-grasp enzyme